MVPLRLRNGNSPLLHESIFGARWTAYFVPLEYCVNRDFVIVLPRCVMLSPVEPLANTGCGEIALTAIPGTIGL